LAVPDARELLSATIGRIRGADIACAAAAERAMDAKTKPRGSLGRLESIAATVAGIRALAAPAPSLSIVIVVAADHGIAAENVSAYPQEVTAQMVLNFAAGGAAVCVLARRAGARLLVVDAGVRSDVGDVPGVLSRRLGPGTANATQGPAMTTEQALRIGQQMAERVRELRIHHPRSAVLRYISVSVGVCAAVPEPSDSPANLLQKSQQQLQIAKKSGRNQAA
jgi:nicotinate-nucleotide--dimethylbenzimidazole phosphoribosyltransferase